MGGIERGRRRGRGRPAVSVISKSTDFSPTVLETGGEVR